MKFNRSSMIVAPLLLFFFGLSSAHSVQDEEVAEAMSSDDQCQDKGSACALNALQLRSQVHAAETHQVEGSWSIFGTTEQCCRCSSGTVGWSASGKCSFCHGKVSKKKSVSSNCKVKSKNFLGNRACATSCRSAVLLEEGELMQTEEETL
eukprot:CAMPEP_0206563596 /NCGR_PEP_ID=MMETSP0325_2-20121206/22940_1 /ASSEMBLY_ACC=CAM_ASM_000347 /TAXON_ID=2866 /ORGANISM="Crypthecodinium cohnii, Strain Seligo" /LENGTH=149 /DNA_ID=CAMNT_0054066031 /DNA_START=153 /DNA_END=599 /DNA_ORIENTATION=-